jgi:flagellar basal body-associated protein FliL
MDSAIAIAAALAAAVIIYKIFKNFSVKAAPKSKEEKKSEIILQYREILENELNSLNSDQKRVAKKTQLLQKFSQELSTNIFFDKDEIREIIFHLAKI